MVTGGLGFIGSNFCRYIVQKQPAYEVTNVDKVGMGANPDSLNDLKNEKKYRFVKGDVSNGRLMRNLVRQADAVVNFAAETHVDRSILNPKMFLRNNTVGTFTVLEAVRKYNKRARLVQVSTDEVYGEIDKNSFTEGDATKPSNPYSASKACADMFVLAYHKTYNLDVSITRCTNNFGPYQFPEKLVPKTIIRAIKGLQIPVYGTGKNVRDWLYVQDHCHAIERVLRRGKQGEIYNISSGDELSNTEIVKRILHLLGKKESLISLVEDRPGHDFRYSLDSSKLRSTLDWKPQVTFEDAMETTVDWYRNNEKWWRLLATEAVLSPEPWKRRKR